jgi:hypothetical protein
MGVSIWVAGPVGILAVLALLSVLGLGQTEIIDAGLDNATWGDINYNNYGGSGDPPLYYDVDGNPKIYANLTEVNPGEGIMASFPYVPGLVFWRNGTTPFTFFPLFHNTDGTNPVKWSEVGQLNGLATNTGGGFQAGLGTTLGLLAVIAGIVAVGVIASVRFFGFGLSDVGINTLMKGGSYILVWAIFSGLAMNLIVAGGDFYTPITYLGLTGVFAFGVMGEIGTPSSGGS